MPGFVKYTELLRRISAILYITFRYHVALQLQVGPLLDWVASLRACTGYPDPTLVAQASYLNENKVRRGFSSIISLPPLSQLGLQLHFNVLLVCKIWF